jgi:colanic acid/amylovoran biosynthesis protein
MPMGCLALSSAQSIGKFTCDDDIAIWKAAEKKAMLITVREPLTKRYLVEELGSDPAKIHETTDCAFLLAPDKNLAVIHQLVKQAPLIGLSISESICKWTAADYETHADAWANIAGRIMNEWGARVVLIPHVQDPGSDDRVVATKVWRKLGFDSRMSLAGGDLSAAERRGKADAEELACTIAPAPVRDQLHRMNLGRLPLGISALSYRYIEQPFSALGRRFKN